MWQLNSNIVSIKIVDRCNIWKHELRARFVKNTDVPRKNNNIWLFLFWRIIDSEDLRRFVVVIHPVRGVAVVSAGLRDTEEYFKSKRRIKHATRTGNQKQKNLNFGFVHVYLIMFCLLRLWIIDHSLDRSIGGGGRGRVRVNLT